MAEFDPESPLWWVSRLYGQLMLRNERTKRYARYYKGQFDLPWLPEQAEDEFRRILNMTGSNYMGLVVDAMVERMNLIGFRRDDSEDGTADLDMWRIWTYNNLDSHHDQGMLEAAIHCAFYYIIEPNRKDPKNPFIGIEHPTQCIVEHVPGTNRRERAAGLKAWIDEWTGYIFANVYTKTHVFKYQAKDPQALMDSSIRAGSLPGERSLIEVGKHWMERSIGKEEFGARHPVREVPLIESPNNPRLLEGGVSELSDLCEIQDRITKTLADRMMTQDYGAFPQRWASAWPKEDASGTANDPIEVGRTRLLTTDIAETRFGQFDAAPLDPYSAAKREDVVDIASRSRTPAHYLIAGLANINGETLKASESGLVSKCLQRMSGHSDPAQDVARMALRLAGVNVPDDVRIETMWSNPEFRTQAETTDALIKMRQAADLPRQVVWERWGATPTEQKRWKSLLEEERQEAIENDPVLLLAEQARKMGLDRPAGGQESGPTSGQKQKDGDPDPGKEKPANDPQKVIKPSGVTS